MPITILKNSKITGICCTLPDNCLSIYDMGKKYFDEEEIEKISKSVGIKYLYLAKPEQTTSDLAVKACEKLILNLNWNKDEIDGLILITQTPDYILPSTANILQYRLGLKKNCIAIQINLGCSGYVYGIWLASEFISNGTCKKVLVIVGDTLSKTTSKQDKSIFMLSDGVAATAVEYKEGYSSSSFSLFSDGSGADKLIIPDGGFRNPVSEKSYILSKDEDGNSRSNMNIFMDGMAIFLFAINQVPSALKEFINYLNVDIVKIDKFLLHQANNYLIKMLARNAKLPIEKIPINIDKFGNTSAASIPLVICDQLKNDLEHKDLNVIMAGFGVGLSWGIGMLKLERGISTSIIYV
ncbi:ketoacyl-ACP synthase III [Thermoanaerobacteraceae bacterium SP2]|nr:ketoacyl-ACP synthase III [Thermoanaerobacteraceae bacterium SP2]